MATATKSRSKITKIQKLQLDLIRLSTFNEFDGDVIADSLIANKALWVACLLDREAHGPFYKLRSVYDAGGYKEGDLPIAPIDTIRLRDLLQDCWNVDALFILPEPGKEDSLELLVRREWNADEINWYDSGDAQYIWLNSPKVGEKVQMLTIPRMLRVWWD